jgi:hypothetical protein
MMQDQGLVRKLHEAGVVDKHVNELKFSDEFCRHLVAYNQAHGFKGSGTIEIWREILVEFNESLDNMSDREVATTIVLLDYFLDKIATRKS